MANATSLNGSRTTFHIASVLIKKVASVFGRVIQELAVPTTNQKRGMMGVTECKFYNKGRCEYFSEARNESRILSRRCCMHIVKPMMECFYYQPKQKKDDKGERCL